MARGIVKWFNAKKGIGAITSSELPPGRDAWVHYSMIYGTGDRTLLEGQHVDFQYEAAKQDSFDYRATSVALLPPEGTAGPSSEPSRRRRER